MGGMRIEMRTAIYSTVCDSDVVNLLLCAVHNDVLPNRKLSIL